MRTAFALFLFVLLLVAPDRARADAVETLRGKIAEVLASRRVAGAGIALVGKGQILWAGGVGVADRATGRPVEATTLFRVGSITKSFVALALLRLQHEGKLDLAATLDELAPEIALPNPWQASDPVRLVHLLEHTAGLEDMHPREVYVASGPDLPLLDVFRTYPAALRVRFRPGTRAIYSNPGYGVAGYVLERKTNKDWCEAIADLVLRPLDMKRSTCRADAQGEGLAQGYDGEKVVPYRRIHHRPAGDLRSTPEDLARLVAFFLARGGGWLPPSAIARAEVPHTSSAARAGLSSGYGLGNATSFRRKLPAHGHDGGIGGFTSSYRYVIESGIGWVVLINGEDGEAVERIEALLFDHLAPEARPPAAAASVPKETLASYEGWYQPTAHRHDMLGILERLLGSISVSRDGSSLVMWSPLRGSQRLVALSPTLFRLEKDSAPSVVFLHEEGKLVLARPMGWNERVSAALPILRLLGVLAALLATLSVPFVFVVQAVRAVKNRPGARSAFDVRVLPFVAFAALATFLVALLTARETDFASANARTVTVAVSSWIFAVAAIAALAASLRALLRSDLSRALRAHSLVASLSLAGLALWLASWGFIGLRLWVY